jgi:hypothetical protein
LTDYAHETLAKSPGTSVTLEQEQGAVVATASARTQEEFLMVLDIPRISGGLNPERRNPVVVELSDRRLPVRMRFSAMRSSVLHPVSRAPLVQRAVMIPGALILRLWGR